MAVGWSVILLNNDCCQKNPSQKIIINALFVGEYAFLYNTIETEAASAVSSFSVVVPSSSSSSPPSSVTTCP